jgi:hypothetical protein
MSQLAAASDPTVAAAAAAKAPLEIQAAAAASLLLEGCAPEDVGAAAGLANPDGVNGTWAPRQLAQLADLITSKLNDAAATAAAAAAAAAATSGASSAAVQKTSDDAWNDDDGGDDDDEDAAPGWWDPEALARLLCALTKRGKADAFMPPVDQATLVHALVSEMRWLHSNAGDLLWCLHSAQEAQEGDAGASSSDVSGGSTMERVEECAEVALELARKRAIRGGGCGWTRADAAGLLPRWGCTN